MPCLQWRSRKTSLASVRKIGGDRLSAPSPNVSPRDKDAEEKRASGVEQQFGKVAPRIVRHTTDVLLREFWLYPYLLPGIEGQ